MPSFALPGQDDLVLVVRRVEALGRFLETEDGRNLLSGYRRAANILKAEEKRDGAGVFDGLYEPAQLAAEEERHLGAALFRTAEEVADCVRREDFEAAMLGLAGLRAPVDAFFERVTVNADEPALRTNRLRLLSALRRAMVAVRRFFQDRRKGLTRAWRPSGRANTSPVRPGRACPGHPRRCALR